MSLEIEKEETEFTEETDNSRRPPGKIYYYDKKLNAAFKKDCEDLFDEYEKLDSLSFDEFADLWRARNFSYIFAAQSCALLLKEFCDDCFYTVKKYIAFPRSLSTQAAALYMLYGIYYKQPVRKWVNIRLTMEEFQKLLEFIQEMNNIGQLDAVYIFKKMMTDGAFLHVPIQRPLGPEDRFVKKHEFYYNDTFASANTTTSLTKFKDIESFDVMKQLEETTNEYQKLLKKYSEKCNGLEPFPSTIVADIRDALADFSLSNTYKKPNVEEDLKRKNDIKKRAMENKNAVYRASKKIRTAVDSDEDVDDPLPLAEEEKVVSKEDKGKRPKRGRASKKGSFKRLPDTVKPKVKHVTVKPEVNLDTDKPEVNPDMVNTEVNTVEKEKG